MKKKMSRNVGNI